MVLVSVAEIVGCGAVVDVAQRAAEPQRGRLQVDAALVPGRLGDLEQALELGVGVVNTRFSEPPLISLPAGSTAKGELGDTRLPYCSRLTGALFRLALLIVSVESVAPALSLASRPPVTLVVSKVAVSGLIARAPVSDTACWWLASVGLPSSKPAGQSPTIVKAVIWPLPRVVVTVPVKGASGAPELSLCRLVSDSLMPVFVITRRRALVCQPKLPSALGVIVMRWRYSLVL